MDNVTVDSPEELENVISADLQEFSDEKMHEIKDIIADKSKECAANIRKDSPRNKGKYFRGWRATKEEEDDLHVSYLIANHSKKAPLTWLLENGHATRNGGRVEAIPHIEPNVKKCVAEIDAEIDKKAAE